MRYHAALGLTAAFAFVWSAIRAHLQSITIDEASSYVAFVSRNNLSLMWTPAAANHVLNSLLMRMSTSVFGASDLTVRLPALFGAAIYIACAYALCTMISRRLIVAWPLFVCLVFNPHIMDYFAAARGYGLADGLLLAAIASIAVLLHASADRRVLLISAIASVCIGLSLTANFSFALIDGATIVMLFLWTWRTTRVDVRRLAAACFIPGAVVALLIAGYTIANWPSGQLYYGSTSLAEMLASVRDSSSYQLNPHLFPPVVADRVTAFLKVVLFPLAGVLCVIEAVFIAGRRAWTSQERWLAALAGVCAGSLVLGIGIHHVEFHVAGLMLPKERTALYMVPLCTLLTGALAAIAPWSAMTRAVTNAMIAILCVTGIYYLCCLRVSHFKEWFWDADVKHAYALIAGYDHRYCLNSVETDGLYAMALNYYRLTSGRESFGEFDVHADPRPGHEVYLLRDLIHDKFITNNHLTVVYRAPASAMVVALSPEAAARVSQPPAVACSEPQPHAAAFVK